MVAIGYERGRADPTPDPDPVHRDGLVAEEADHAGQRHQPDVVVGPRVGEGLQALVADQHRRRCDEQHDDDAGEVLDAAETVGEPSARRTAQQDERDPQRHRGESVRHVVDGVGQQRDGPAEQEDNHLQQRGDGEDDQTDLGGADPRGRGHQSAVDGVCVVVAVRAEEVGDAGTQPSRPCRAVVMGRRVVVVLVPVVAHPVVAACCAWERPSSTRLRTCSFASR